MYIDRKIDAESENQKSFFTMIDGDELHAFFRYKSDISKYDGGILLFNNNSRQKRIKHPTLCIQYR